MPTGNAAAIYYRSVCTSCHVAMPVGAINPSTKTKAEWAAYLKADKHAKGKDTVKQYVSKAYRASIKSGNKAAEKFADVPDQELLEDVAAFLKQRCQGRRRTGQLQLIQSHEDGLPSPAGDGG